jgi:hypothetical protein
MEDRILVMIVAIICLTALGITYFLTIRQDSTVLLTLSSIIGGLAGYRIGRKKAK